MNLIFPKLCLHCKAVLEKKKRLCADCLKEFELIPPETRCLHCFSALEEQRQVCLLCRRKPLPLRRVAAAFEQIGPAASLLSQFRGSQHYLAKEIAAFLLVQFYKLQWPLPDLITAVPSSFLSRLEKGYHPSFLIAKELGKMVDRPAHLLLKRRWTAPSSQALSIEKRKELPVDTFTWKKRISIADQTLLIIDDLLVTGTSLSHTATQLQEGCPKALYGLVFCINN